MKCPFCNGELVGTIGHPICRNQNCVMCDDPMPQDLLEELITTRKALDVAVDALNKIYNENGENCINGCDGIANKALEQINEITKGNK